MVVFVRGTGGPRHIWLYVESGLIALDGEHLEIKHEARRQIFLFLLNNTRRNNV